METLKELQDYASTMDNVYLQNKLELIEIQINMFINTMI